MKRKLTKYLIALAMALTPLLGYAQTEGLLAGALSGGDLPNYVLGTNASADGVKGDSYSGECQWFYVQEGCDYYLPYGFAAERCTWNAAGTGSETAPTANRTFTINGLASAYLPFPFTLTNQAVLKGYKLYYKNNHVAADKTDNTFVFIQMTDGSECEANMAYVLQGAASAAAVETSAKLVPPTPVAHLVSAPKTTGLSVYQSGSGKPEANLYLATNTGANGSTINDPVGSGTWGFRGTTERIDNTSATNWEAFTLNGGAWTQVVSGASYVSPMRGFMYGIDAQAYAKTGVITFKNTDGETTGIATINSDGEIVNKSIYNVAGQYVGTDFNSLPKGVYIVNGVKTIKK